MGSIPLPQFPPDFRPRCYKCNSLTLHFNFTRHPWAWNQTEIQFSCGMCGAVGYGENTVIAKFSPQLVSWQREQEQRQAGTLARERERERESQRAREAVAAARVAEEEQRREEERLRNEARLRAQLEADMLRSAAEVGAQEDVPDDSGPQSEVDPVERRRARDRARKARARAAAREARIAAAVQADQVRPLPPLPDPIPPQAELPSAPDLGKKCFWSSCNRSRVGSSKYCSRACSNRNARHNAKLRSRAKTKSDT